MKKLSYSVILLALSIASCDSDVSDRLDDMAGIWQLEEMTYTDPQGVAQTITDSETTLTFTKKIAGKTTEEVDGVRYGTLDTGEEDFRYQYSVDFSRGYIDILFEDETVRREDRLPLDAPGRRQVYDFEQPSESSMVISTPQEFNQDRADTDIFANVRYLFKRQ